MARYFARERTGTDMFGRTDKRVVVEAIGEKIKSKRHLNYNQYKQAYMAADVIPEFEEPNFEFGLPDPSDTSPAATVKRAVGPTAHGTPLSRHTVGTTDQFNAFSAASHVLKYVNQTPLEDLKKDAYLRSHKRKVGIDYAKNISRLKKMNPNYKPTELFRHTPQETLVTEAYAHPDLSHTVPILAAQMHKMAGMPLTASSSLSVHSAPLVRNARKSGFPVRGNPYNNDLAVSNGEGYYDMGQFYTDSVPENEMSESDVRGAKQHFVELRKEAKAKKTLRTSGIEKAKQYRDTLRDPNRSTQLRLFE